MTATILCYHKVGPLAEEGRRLNVAPERLESHVRFFARQRRPYRLARDLARPWPSGVVCFTFDDAYHSAVCHAPPILEKYGMRGSFYAVGSKVGGSSDWDGPLARPLATWEQLEMIDNAGHEVGNHTFSHPRMANLTVAHQRSEIQSAHEAFEAHSIFPASFCYPYGSFNEEVISTVRESGYPVALELGKKLATSDEDPLRLSRVVVACSDALPMLLYRLYVRPRLRHS